VGHEEAERNKFNAFRGYWWVVFLLFFFFPSHFLIYRSFHQPNPKPPMHCVLTFAINKSNIDKRLGKRGMEFGADGMYSMSIIELMSYILCEPAPRLGPRFPEEFVNACLMKNPDERHSPKTLLVRIS